MVFSTRHIDPILERQLDNDISAITGALDKLSLEETSVKERVYRQHNPQCKAALELCERQIQGLPSRIEAVREQIPALTGSESNLVRKIQECHYIECRLTLLRHDCQHLLELVKDAAYTTAITNFTKLSQDCAFVVESKGSLEEKQKQLEELRSSLTVPSGVSPESDLPLSVQSALMSLYKNSLCMLLQTHRTVSQQFPVDKQSGFNEKIDAIQDRIGRIPSPLAPLRSAEAVVLDTSKVALRSFFSFNSTSYISRWTYYRGGCKDAVRIGENNLATLAKSVQQLTDELSEWVKALCFAVQMPEDFTTRYGALSSQIGVLMQQIRDQIYAATPSVSGLVQTEFNRLVPEVYMYADALLEQLQDLERALLCIQTMQINRQDELQPAEICAIFFRLYQERSAKNSSQELLALFNAFKAVSSMSKNSKQTILSEALANKSKAVLLQTKEESALIEAVITKSPELDASKAALALAKRALLLLYCREPGQLDMVLELCQHAFSKDVVLDELGPIFAAYHDYMRSRRLENELLQEAVLIASEPLVTSDNQAIAIKRYVRFKSGPTAHPDTLSAMASFLYQRIERQCSEKPFSLQDIISIAELIAQFRPAVALEAVPALSAAAAANQE